MLTRFVLVHCDVCGVHLDYDQWHEDAAKSRAEARAMGWHCGRRGDLCPEHA